MTKILTAIERQRLLVRHKKSREKQEADCIKVVLLVDDGWSLEKIAKALCLDESTVGSHFHAYEEEKCLKPDYKGSKLFLSEEDSFSLFHHLEENLYPTVKECLTETPWVKTHGISCHKLRLPQILHSENLRKI